MEPSSVVGLQELAHVASAHHLVELVIVRPALYLIVASAQVKPAHILTNAQIHIEPH